MKATLPQQWANRINAHGEQAVESIMAMGRDLIAAKKQLGHGAWGQMFRDHPQAVATPLRFSVNTAQRLMAIANHAVLPKAAHGQLLPPSWRTLYDLTKVPDSTLQAALTDGRIHPGMERREVQALRQPRARPQATRTIGPMARLAQALHSEIMTRPLDEAEGVLEELESLLAALTKRFQARRTKEIS
jgi:hypothetical protein